jgi:Sugar-transfer associated ATP-grasp
MNKIKEYFDLARKMAQNPKNKGVARQIFELVALFCRSQLGPGYYFKAQMCSQNYTFSEVMDFLSLRQYERQVYRLNNRLYHKCSQNKSVEKAILSTYGIPTPELLGHFHGVRGLTTQGDGFRTKAQLQELLYQQSIGDRLCFKLIDGWGGIGFRAIECLSNQRFLDLQSQEESDFDGFYQSLGNPEKEGLIIERYLEQHSAFSSFNPSSVNTCRVLLRVKEGDVICLSAYLRVGRVGSLVDNSTSGGVIFPIDKMTGIMKPGFTKHDRGNFYDAHPDSGVQMNGEKLPCFDEGMMLAKKVILAFPGINFAGVDLAFSKDGPVILEINIQPDYNDFADTSLPSRSALM